jgi:hypothetical protein
MNFNITDPPVFTKEQGAKAHTDRTVYLEAVCVLQSCYPHWGLEETNISGIPSDLLEELLTTHDVKESARQILDLVLQYPA